MITEDDLIAAAATIRTMPQPVVSQRLLQLEEEHRRRRSLTGVRQGVDVDDVLLDEAAYQLGRQHHAGGDLAEAARWYREAAAHDYADAALLLGNVLEMLAEKYITSPSPRASGHEELNLVTEAARWYIEAYGAGHLEAAERVEALIGRHDPDRVGPVSTLAPTPPECEEGGLGVVLEERELEAAVKHFASCLACKAELLSHGGLLPTIRPSPPLKARSADDASEGLKARSK